MSNELNFALGETGLTAIAKLYLNGAQVGSNIALTEISGAGGLYTANMPAVDRGDYSVICLVAGEMRSFGSISWDGAKEVTPLAQVDAVAGYKVITIVDTTTTMGNVARVMVCVVKQSGERVDLHTVDPDATCEVSVIRFGNVPQFDLSTEDMGAPNAAGWFEASYENPNFDTDISYVAMTTVVVDGQTYQDRVEFFSVWP